MITNEVLVTIVQAYFSLPRLIRKGMVIRWIIASDLCRAVGCQQFPKESRKLQRRIMFERRACERGVQGYIVPGPGLRGPGRVEVVATSFKQNFFFCLALNLSLFLGKKSSPNFGQKIGPNLSEDLFLFCSPPNFGQKIGPNLSEDLFFLLST